jgi:hypothetical protein
MKNIAESEHPRQYVHYTVRRDNLEDINPAAEELSRFSNIRGITYQFFYPYTQEDLTSALSPEERVEAVNAIEEVRKNGPIKVLNSRSGLKRMARNDWRCREWLLANVDPDGTVSQGCYVKGRGAVRCEHCGFTPVAELSRAWEMHTASIAAGLRIFL